MQMHTSCPKITPTKWGKLRSMMIFKRSGQEPIIINERQKFLECPNVFEGQEITLHHGSSAPSVILPKFINGKPLSGRDIIFFKQIGKRLNFSPVFKLTPGGGFNSKLMKWTGSYANVSMLKHKSFIVG